MFDTSVFREHTYERSKGTTQNSDSDKTTQETWAPLGCACTRTHTAHISTRDAVSLSCSYLFFLAHAHRLARPPHALHTPYQPNKEVW